MLNFSSDSEMNKVAGLAAEFSKNILVDEEPFFISDEANALDVSGEAPDELIRRISFYYGKSISLTELKQPLWKLLLQLNEGRT